MEFSFIELLTSIMKRRRFIMTGTIVGLVAFFVFNQYIINPRYTSSVQLYVSANTADTSADLNSLNYAQKVVTTYINFLQTNTFYHRVIIESGLEYDPDQLRKMTWIETINNTEIFQISVTSHNPQDSYQLAATMQAVAPELIKSILNTAAISVVDPVAYPEAPSGPNVWINTMIGGILGLLLTAATALLWEMINNNVKNQEDLEKKYDLPVLGAIPDFHTSNKKMFHFVNKIPFVKKRLTRKVLQSNINDETGFIITEAFNSLRTNLRFLIRHEGCKKIMITSPNQGEGKSTISANLAKSIAQTGSKVLLLDCDLRRGTLHSFFDIKGSPGVTDTLSGMYTENEVLQDTAHSNLQVISMGSIPPNSAELLASKQMEDLLKYYEKQYSYIIIDTPPVNILSDAFGMIKLIDGVIMVVREESTSHSSISNAIAKFKFSEANILGFVLNALSCKQGKKKEKYSYYSKSR
jgi:capsular exopolysaccharide synthesis family protein